MKDARSPVWEACGVLLALIVFLIAACTIAQTRMLWYDELFTRQVLQQTSWARIVASLHTGLDLQPPLFFLLTRWTRFVGGEEMGLRLPAIVGFAFAGLSVYAVARRWFRPGYAMGAALAPCILFFNPLAVEARPYGLMLGFSALALLGWTCRRLRPAIGTALYLAGMLATAMVHYYGFLLAVPFGVAALWTAIRARRLDLWTLAGCLCAILPNLWSYRLIQVGIALYKTGAWNHPNWFNSISTAFLWQLAILAVLFIASQFARRPGSRAAGDDSAPDSEMLACWVGFLMIPLVAVIMAMTVSGMVTPRYSLMQSLGFGLLAMYLLERAAAGRRWVGYVAGCGAIMVFAYVVAKQARFIEAERNGVVSSCAELEELLQRPEFSQSRLMIGDPHCAMQFAHYCQEVRSRIVFPADTARSQRYLGYDSAHKGLLQFRGYFELNVEPLEEIVHQERHRLLVLHSFQSFLPDYFAETPESAARLHLLGKGAGFDLYSLDPLAPVRDFK